MPVALQERPPLRVELDPYDHVAKTGGTSGACFDAWNYGVIGDIARGDAPPPRILVPSAPGVILPNLRTRGAQFHTRDGEIFSRGGVFIPFGVPVPELGGHQVPKSEKLTHHAAWAIKERQNGNKEASDKHYDAIYERFMEIASEAGVSIKRYRRQLRKFHTKLKWGEAREGNLEEIQGKMVTDFLNNSGKIAVYLNPAEYVVTGKYGEVMVEPTRTKMRAYLHNENNSGRREVILVHPSHTGVTESGVIRDLTRNCGEEVAAVMARAAKRPVVIYGSTNGVESIDRDKYRHAKPRMCGFLMSTEMHTAAGSGAGVIGVRGVEPVGKMKQGQIQIRNFQSPNIPRTIVERERRDSTPGPNKPLMLIAGEEGNIVVFYNRAANSGHDFVPRLAQALEERGVGVRRITPDDTGQKVVAFVDTDGPMSEREAESIAKQIKADSGRPRPAQGMITLIGDEFERHPDAESRRGAVVKELGVKPRESVSTGRGCAWRYQFERDEFVDAITLFHRRLIEEADAA